jgi:hypothetical protein
MEREGEEEREQKREGKRERRDEARDKDDDDDDVCTKRNCALGLLAGAIATRPRLVTWSGVLLSALPMKTKLNILSSRPSRETEVPCCMLVRLGRVEW